MVKAGVVTVVRLPRSGSVIALQCLTDFLPFDAQLLHDLPLAAACVIQRFSVDQIDRFRHIMDRLGRYQAASIHAEKGASKVFCQFINRGIGLINSIAGDMDHRLSAAQREIENILCQQRNMCAVRDHRNSNGIHSASSQTVFRQYNTFQSRMPSIHAKMTVFRARFIENPERAC